MGKITLLTAIFFIFLAPLAYSVTLQDLISFFNFNFFTAAISVTNHTDFMIDRDNNSINDTLILELTADGNSGNYLVAVDLFDENIITNETNKSLTSGINKFNISFPAEFFTKNRFNYTIKIYGEDYSLKYSKEGIGTDYYANYEEGIKIAVISDKSADNNSLQLNFAVNSTKNGSYEISAYLQHNGSIIFSKANRTIISGMNNITISFDSETIKNTHYSGKYNLTSVKISNKIIRVDYATNHYDYGDFSKSSYFSGFSDHGVDSDNNGLLDFLSLNATLETKNNASYNAEADLYDLFGNFIEKQEKTMMLSSGKNYVALNFNGTNIYAKKLNGPYIIKYAKLAENNSTNDEVNDFYTTQNYNYTNFETGPMPDLKISIEVSDGFRYGINNLTLNITINNLGDKNAFNVFLEIFDNRTYSINKSINILSANDHKKYPIEFINASDFEINAIADFDDFVEESNESNNIAKEEIRINKKPILNEISNITINETGLILINATALDPNGDSLAYSINDSKFFRDGNIFSWKTTTMDSGNYTIRINVSDGYLYDYSIFEIVVLDRKEIDADDDGINDSLDRVIGMPEHINTSTINVSFLIGNSSNLSKIFNGTQKIEFKDRNATIVEFDFNFSNASINLSNIVMDKQDNNASGAVVFSIRNMTLPAGFTKTVYLDRLNQSENGVCAKDTEVMAINEIGNDCNGINEHKIECDGTLQDGYNCSYMDSTGKYKVTGLKHSGIKQIDFEKPETQPSASSSGGGSGSGGSSSTAACIEQWSCAEWLECVDNVQARICNDLSKCGIISNKPIGERECPTIKKTETKNQEFEETNPDKGKTVEKTSGNSPLPKITGLFAANTQADPRIGISVVVIIVITGLLAFYGIMQSQLKIFK
ncbi:hypothetical protein HYU09_05460 [Candidatus Woesearchaeota archaeon]|nr:hypothetical protein [Candidatus Woesearchaeota archaeon]